LGFSFNVVVTVRSQEKGQRIIDSIDKAQRQQVAFVVVEEIAEEGAFDEVKRFKS